MISISGLSLRQFCLLLFLLRSMGRHHHNTKTDVVVPVVGIVPVAVRTADVPLIIVERTAAQHTDDVFDLPRRNTPAVELYVVLFSSPAPKYFPYLLDHAENVLVLPHVEELEAETQPDVKP
jgi:hypothetical protein